MDEWLDRWMNGWMKNGLMAVFQVGKKMFTPSCTVFPRWSFFTRLCLTHSSFSWHSTCLLLDQASPSLHWTQPSLPCSLAFLPGLSASLLNTFLCLSSLLNGKLMHILRVQQSSLFNPPLIPQNSTQTHKQILSKPANFIESNGNKLHKTKPNPTKPIPPPKRKRKTKEKESEKENNQKTYE